MDNSHLDEHDNIPGEIKQQIDRVCLDFRNDWQADKAPQIEDFVSRVPASGQQAVMFRLLMHEIELCFAEGKASSRSEYLSRFQDDQWIVEAVFEKAPELSFQNCSLTDTVSHGPKHGPAQVDTDAHSPLALKGSCVSDSESNSVLKQIGRFAIQKRLGQGGFGEVFLAHDPVLDRNVAIKFPRPERFSSAEVLESFTAESKTTARLKHTNIVTMYDVVRCDQGLFIVQEFVDGQDLRQFITAQTMPLPVERSVSLILAIADAMAFAHESGFVHRDLKPENILLDHRQRPLVADFGLAVHENHQRRKRGEVSGSPLYMSPEQVRGETHRLDGRSDLWSIGVIFYELLTGRQPFRGETQNQIFVKYCLASLFPSVSGALMFPRNWIEYVRSALPSELSIDIPALMT